MAKLGEITDEQRAAWEKLERLRCGIIEGMGEAEDFSISPFGRLVRKNMAKLNEVTKEQKAAWCIAAEFPAPSPMADLVGLAKQMLARALKAEFGVRCFEFDYAPNDNAGHNDEMKKHSWTDADWLAEAERILKG